MSLIRNIFIALFLLPLITGCGLGLSSLPELNAPETSVGEPPAAADEAGMEEEEGEEGTAEGHMAAEENTEIVTDVTAEEDAEAEDHTAVEDDTTVEEEEEGEGYDDDNLSGEEEEEDGGMDQEENRARQYRLGSGDRLSIIVFGQNDLSGEFEVSGNGEISLPLAGQISAAGLTTSELQERVTKILDESYLVDPRVNVDVVNYRPFYVLGEVNRPGRYDYVSGLDMRQAIALAGGFTRRGYQSAVKLIRDEPDGRVEYKAELDAPLNPGDTIEAVRRLF